MSPPPKYNRPEAPQWLSQSIRLECSSQPLLTHPGVCTGLLPKDTAPATPFQAPGSSCSQGKHGTAIIDSLLLLRKRFGGFSIHADINTPGSMVKRCRTIKYPKLEGTHRDHPAHTSQQFHPVHPWEHWPSAPAALAALMCCYKAPVVVPRIKECFCFRKH